MILKIFLFLFFQSYLILDQAFCEESKNAEQMVKEKAVVDEKKNVDVDFDLQIIDEFLADAKNPFLSVIPEEKKVVKPPEVTPPKPPVVKPKGPDGIPQTVLDMSDKLKIEGLVWNTDLPLTIINGQLLAEGESILSAKVVKITQKGVQIKYNGYSIFIKNKIE